MDVPMLAAEGGATASDRGGSARTSSGRAAAPRPRKQVLAAAAAGLLLAGVLIGSLATWGATSGGGGGGGGSGAPEVETEAHPESIDDSNATIGEILSAIAVEGVGQACRVPSTPPSGGGSACVGTHPDSTQLVVSERTLDLVREFEGWYPEFYVDPVGIRTIGYGHACHARRCTGPPFDKGYLTPQEGLDLLVEDLKTYEACVRRHVSDDQKLTLNQYGALVSFTFNVGCGNLRSSTLLKHLNAGRHSEVGAQFRRWVKGGGRTLPGLVRRREAEASLFDDRSDCGSWPAFAGGDLDGVCRLTDTCKGESVPGFCPGPSGVRCCVREPASGPTCAAGDEEGTCVLPDRCDGHVVASGATGCHLGSDARCCLPAHIKPPLPDDSCLGDRDGGLGTCSSAASCGDGSHQDGSCEDGGRCCVPSTPTPCQAGQPDGPEGQCLSTTECRAQGNVSVAGFCAGPASRQCCVRPQPERRVVSCVADGLQGSCMHTSGCDGRSVPGHCPGASSNQCCVTSGVASCVASGVRGTCADVSHCAGRVTRGLCPGSSSVLCCTDDEAVDTACSFPSGTQTGQFDAYSRGTYLGKVECVKLGSKWVERNTACALQPMMRANPRLRINSGFRTMASQQYLYNCYKTGKCNNGNLAAPPGYSNHQNGLAVDMGPSSQYAWLKTNGPRYGFRFHFIRSEPWHGERT